MPATASTGVAGEETDDGVENGDDAVDNGHDDAADSVDDGHDGPANGTDDVLDAGHNSAHVYGCVVFLGVESVELDVWCLCNCSMSLWTDDVDDVRLLCVDGENR